MQNNHCKIYISTDTPLKHIVREINERLLQETKSNNFYIYFHENEDYNNEKKYRFPDGFLFFEYTMDIEIENLSEEYIDLINSILTWLWEKNIPAIASCDFEDKLVYLGGYNKPELPFPTTPAVLKKSNTNKTIPTKLFRKIYPYLIVLLTIYIVYFNATHHIYFHAFHLEGKVRFFSIAISFLYFFTIFKYLFNRSKYERIKVDDDYPDLSPFIKTPKFIVKSVDIIFTFVITSILFIVFLLFFTPTDFIHYYNIEYAKNIQKDSLCTVIKEKYEYTHHGKTFHRLVLDTVPYHKEYELGVSKNCYDNRKVGDSLEFIYRYQKGLIYYIDFEADTIMHCPPRCSTP